MHFSTYIHNSLYAHSVPPNIQTRIPPLDPPLPPQSFVMGAAESGFVVGLNKCEYIDRFLDQPGPVLKPGQLDFNGTPHEPFTSIVRAANKQAQEVVGAQLS